MIAPQVSRRQEAALLFVIAHGWQWLCIEGSHHVYGKAGQRARISVPVHGNRPLKVGLQRHEKQAPEFAIARAIIAARGHAGLSQAGLAISQPVVACPQGRPHPAEHAHPAEDRRSHRRGAGIPPEAKARGGSLHRTG